jgi:2-methylisocitrate lyase-like PEP mutase family enzyme
MARRISFRKAAEAEQPFVTPTAHDAFTARMIERAGFKGISIGGSTMLAARYALPDLGLAALGEMVAGARDILAASSLPVIMDGDDGYGDVKSVVRLVRGYEEMGIGAVVLEDQVREVKQAGNNNARSVVPVEVLAHKLRVAVAERDSTEFMVIARCDAYGVEGVDGALRRCERYLKAGADGVFIPGIRNAEELRRVGTAFRGTYQIVDMVEGKPPWLTPGELSALGFSQIVYPAHVMLRSMLAIESALSQLRDFVGGKSPFVPLSDVDRTRASFREIVGEATWTSHETRFGQA